MYEAFYGLKAKPFSLLPDPRFLYLSSKHRPAFTMLEYALVNQAGFTVITGEVGCGKTTLIQALMDRVTEEDIPVVMSNYEHLKALEWMIGTWVDQGEQSLIETTCAWTKNRNFITRMFSASVRDRVEMAVTSRSWWIRGR